MAAIVVAIVDNVTWPQRRHNAFLIPQFVEHITCHLSKVTSHVLRWVWFCFYFRWLRKDSISKLYQSSALLKKKLTTWHLSRYLVPPVISNNFPLLLRVWEWRCFTTYNFLLFLEGAAEIGQNFQNMPWTYPGWDLSTMHTRQIS